MRGAGIARCAGALQARRSSHCRCRSGQRWRRDNQNATRTLHRPRQSRTCVKTAVDRMSQLSSTTVSTFIRHIRGLGVELSGVITGIGTAAAPAGVTAASIMTERGVRWVCGVACAREHDRRMAGVDGEEATANATAGGAAAVKAAAGEGEIRTIMAVLGCNVTSVTPNISTAISASTTSVRNLLAACREMGKDQQITGNQSHDVGFIILDCYSLTFRAERRTGVT